jgi:uncharacterized oligopeptide transporter (OPT) family protein
MLLAGMVAGAASKIGVLVLGIKKLSFPGVIAAKPSGALAGKGLSSMTMKNLGFALDPSIMMIAVGAIIGIRAAASMMRGAVVAWLFLAPYVLEAGWAVPGAADKGWFGPVVKWMLWPGVAMMVTASLTSFAFSWRAVLRAFGFGKSDDVEEDHDPGRGHEVPRPVYIAAVAAVAAFSVLLQVMMFGIAWWLACAGVVLTFGLAIVAGRVSGETGVTPVGAMGKVTQLTFGVVNPGNAVSNLMAANVTGGAASQCADLLNDLKSGLMLGAAPRDQVVAQAFGVLAGAIFGSAAYLVLIPDPANMLLTEEWAAPAVAQWKAVAEVFAEGIEAMPEGALTALWVGGVVGIALAIIEKIAPKSIRAWIPSPVSIGLAFAIPAYYAFSFFLGAVFMLLGERFAKSWTVRFGIVLAAGIMAGESLAGVGDAVVKMVQGLTG